MDNNICICTSLRRAAQISTAHYDRALAPAGLRVTMFRLLKTIRRKPDLTLTALAAALDLDRSTLGRNLTVLEKRGLIERMGLADERAFATTLTDAGNAKLDAAEPLWRAAQSDMRQRLDGASADLLDLLQRVEA